MILHQLLFPICRLWFMEYAIIGEICGIFVIGSSLLIVSHFSSEPGSRNTFNTSNTFFYLNQNICCEYSKEPTQ